LASAGSVGVEEGEDRTRAGMLVKQTVDADAPVTKLAPHLAAPVQDADLPLIYFFPKRKARRVAGLVVQLERRSSPPGFRQSYAKGCHLIAGASPAC